MAITQAIVDAELDNSVENDGPVDLMNQTPEQICIDLGTYSPPCEGAEVDELLPLVTNWLERHVVG
jgi:hypothetical protein